MVNDLFDGPSEADGSNKVEHQAVVGITLPGDGDEEFTGNGVGHEQSGGVGAEEYEDFQHDFRHRLYQSNRADDDYNGNPQPGVEGEGHGDDEGNGSESKEQGDDSEVRRCGGAGVRDYLADKNAQAEGQHASDEVVAQAVEAVAVWVAEDLQEPTDCYQRHHIPRTAAIEQEAIDDVELHHQSEEPIDARPDDLVGLWQHINIHQQLGDDIVPMEGEAARGDGINHDEQHKAHNEHPQEFQIMIAEEGERINGSGRVILSRIMALSPRFILILPDKAIAAEKEEHRHAVVPEERKQMHGQELIGMDERLPQTINTLIEELILVLLHDTLDVVAVVMQHDSEDGNTTHRRTLRPCQ